MQFFSLKLKFLLVSSIILNQTGHTQTENIIRDLSSSDLLYVNKIESSPIQQMDSVAHTTGPARYFANIYGKTMQAIEKKIIPMTAPAQMFIKKFEINFAAYFLNAFYSYKDGDFSSSPEWKCLFLHPELQPWQLVLLGVNAHTNIDIWQSLVNNFSKEEIEKYRKQFLSLQSAIAKVYRPLFDAIMNQKGYLKFINSFTKGFAKITGERILYRWRKRNVNLAILYYRDPAKFKKQWAIVEKKKQKIDEIILRK